MTSPLRRAFAAATITAAAAGAVLVPASPASAAAVDGYLDAYAYYRSDVVDCDFAQSDDTPARKEFTPASSPRTARTVSTFEASPAGGDLTSAGRVENATRGSADGSSGAFNTVRFSAEHLVRLRNNRATDCGLGLIADSQSGANLVVKRRGRVHLEWDRGRQGQIEQIFVARMGGGTVVDRIRPPRHGDLTFRVRPGDYVIFVQFQTRASERNVPVGAERTKRAHFKVVADYRR